MEIRKSFDFRILFFLISFLTFVILLSLGLSPAEATAQYDISGSLFIPSIELSSDVASLTLDQNKLNTPDEIVGSFSNHDNKTLLIGHSSTVFNNLHDVTIGNVIIYNEHKYIVVDIDVLEKEAISMSKILKSEKENTLVLMTCAGEDYGNGDSSHRLILTATAL